MGQMLGRYELVRPLARGGMAELYLARRRAAGGVEKRLVIKRVRREWATDARFMEMFVREARLSMSFAHKNIVPVFDFGRAGDELFLVMEYVDGVDLAAALAQAAGLRVPRDPIVMAYVAAEACQALEYVQSAASGGIVHRDVTPANVLLSYSGEVKLLDFGLATPDAIDDAGRVRGTPAYMAPEQARGEPLTARTDVFALGLVLWEALAGRRAYTGREPAAVLERACRGEVPPLEAAGVPTALRAIVERATSTDPVMRYADARALHGALDEYLVDARAASPRRTPAHQLLTEWLTALFPERIQPQTTGPIAVPEGPVATFLDDGEVVVTRATSTARSMAATVADAETSPPPAQPPAPRARLLGRRELGAIAIAVAGAGALIAVLIQRSGGGGEPGPRPAPTGDQVARATEAPGPDAMPPGPGPAPEPTLVADAPPAPPAHTMDAGTVASRPRTHTHAARPPAISGPAQAASGKVRLSSTPWARVRVVGRAESCAETPCTLSLPAGLHTIELDNPVAHLRKTIAVEVTPGTTLTRREALTESP